MKTIFTTITILTDREGTHAHIKRGARGALYRRITRATLNRIAWLVFNNSHIFETIPFLPAPSGWIAATKKT
jgi:hypothetical protein